MFPETFCLIIYKPIVLRLFNTHRFNVILTEASLNNPIDELMKNGWIFNFFFLKRHLDIFLSFLFVNQMKINQILFKFMFVTSLLKKKTTFWEN